MAVIKEATAGNPERDNWHTEGDQLNAPKEVCEKCDKAGCKTCDHNAMKEWKREIFTGKRKGGPSTEEAYKYLKTAKVTVLDKVTDLDKFITK